MAKRIGLVFVVGASFDVSYTFRQDGAPAYAARDTVVLLKQMALNFIPCSLWPHYSPDLNPVDYAVSCKTAWL